MPASSSNTPGRFRGPHHPFPIRSCSMWGLPSRLITQPLVRSYRTFPPLPAEAGGLNLYSTFPGVTPAGRYPAHCPMEPGLSSNAKRHPRLSFVLINNNELIIAFSDHIVNEYKTIRKTSQYVIPRIYPTYLLKIIFPPTKRNPVTAHRS